MTRERVAQVSAWLVALYAVDVLVPIIDILGLPVPRYVAFVSFSAVFILTALGVLVPMARRHRSLELGSAGVTLIGILLFWSGVEVIGTAGRGPIRFDLVLEFVPLLLVTVAARLHLRLFDDPQLLMSALILTASFLVLAHTVLVLAVALGMPLPFVTVGELQGRNAMALLVLMCLWLLVFFPLKGWDVFAHRYNLLLALALANIMLVSARSALLILLWVILLGAALRLPALRRWLRRSLAPVGLSIVVGTMLAYPLLVIGLDELAHVFVGEGDDAISVWSRAQTNAMLLDKFAQSPLLGIGWDEVAATKAYGYMGHTLYVNVFAAYGVVGALAAIWLLSLGLLRTEGRNREVAAHLMFLAILVATFNNNVFAYFGVAIALIGEAKLPYISRGKEN